MVVNPRFSSWCQEKRKLLEVKGEASKVPSTSGIAIHMEDASSQNLKEWRGGGTKKFRM